ncbi:hypothetical protein J32TS6_18990 [Virgibacillus pantothenticus]|uniref:hypothetical protein n=1 Tax=Virgibacillus pantothenticus TaxID=1473 RepID=UPI001B0D22D7|nr:hypothetical protein [Virgibacillus pantothenticus]GIP63344.1 hypothetical protein J32TS6_18990 [Virgibacillus pantothenticus]
MKSYVIKVNGYYYAGEREDTTPIPRPTEGWYTNRGESNVIFFVGDITKAKVCEGLVNLNSHWQRIYNAMRFDGLDMRTIEIVRADNIIKDLKIGG